MVLWKGNDGPWVFYRCIVERERHVGHVVGIAGGVWHTTLDVLHDRATSDYVVSTYWNTARFRPEKKHHLGVENSFATSL